MKWTVRQPRSHGKRLLLLTNSTAAVGALSKGRSSAFSSLTIIRSISSLCLLFNVRLYVCWLPTTCNPADLPSRVQTLTMAAVLVPRSSRLHRAAVTADTHKRYYNATRDFVHWAQQNKEEPANIEELDETLNEYIHWMFDTGGSKDAAYKALFGTMHFLIGAKNRSTFPFSRKSMRGWSKLYPPRAGLPLTWELCCAIAFQFVRAGRPEFAVAVLVAFDGMFRCGELAQHQRRRSGYGRVWPHWSATAHNEDSPEKCTHGFESQQFKKFFAGGSRASDLMQSCLNWVVSAMVRLRYAKRC